MSTKGAFSHRLKARFSLDRDRAKKMEAIATLLHRHARVLSTDFPGLDDPRLPFQAQVVFEVPSALDEDDRVIRFEMNALPVLLFTQLRDLPAPSGRAGDFSLPFRYELQQEVRYTAPSEGYEANLLNPPVSLDYPDFQFSKTYTRGGNGVALQYNLVVNDVLVEREHYAEFHAGVQKMLDESASLVAYVRREVDPERERPKGSVTQGEDIPAFLALARGHVARGRYDEARKVLDRALERDGENAEAHYLLGLTLGYLDEYDESAEAFRRARKLGHRS